MANYWDKWSIPQQLKDIFAASNNVVLPRTRDELIELSLGGKDNLTYDVYYDIEGIGRVDEANIVKCKNGLAVNYADPYMRRRDPDCMVVNNISKTDKVSYQERFNASFDELRSDTFSWLKSRGLIILPFMAGGNEFGYPALLVAPENAGFFVTSLCDLQGMAHMDSLESEFAPKAIIYLAPPFRHTHFDGKQIVVHNNEEGIHEIFSYNLYPGPSAKKGVYGILLSIGVDEGWTTIHGSTVKVTTPYDNEVTILHEGASGSGKSEMLEYPHRQKDGRLLLGLNTVNGDKKFIALNQSCQLQPITDDMALCHPKFQNGEGKLMVADAEEAWFVRINHIRKYGVDPHLDELTIHAEHPLIFLNIEGHPNATCLIWEHTEDLPGVPCPNPRVIVPRQSVQGIINGPVEVDYRSFGIRTPVCSRKAPSYGIFGMLHILPPALAWLWRLVAPRGFSNPSIIDTDGGLSSEGVGSYWPFATGRRVDHANLLLEQILNTPETRHILIPNQHIGVWEVGFMAQWIVREYLARRGQASFKRVKLKPSRCSLAGYTLSSMQVEGTMISDKFLEVNTQPEVGNEGYDSGAEILYDFFSDELKQYLVPDLHPLGKKIIKCCLQRGSHDDYEKLIPGKY